MFKGGKRGWKKKVVFNSNRGEKDNGEREDLRHAGTWTWRNKDNKKGRKGRPVNYWKL